MITPRIKALFRFIDYLYSNIETYKKYSKDIDDLNLLRTDQRQLKPKNNYKDRLKCNELNEAIERKQNVLYDKITTPIQAKSNELNICDFKNTNQSHTGEWRNSFLHEIEQLKSNIINSDLSEIVSHKDKYLKVRTETKNEVIFGLNPFFADLDGLLKEFFDFFKDTEQNEFEAFETKPIQQQSNIKSLTSQPISVNESRTKKVIYETITNIDKQGWEYAFVSEQDYNLFTDLLTNFFEYKPYTLPETIIQLKRTCKTKVAKALGEIHKELSNENKLSTDTKYFQLIRVLSHFEKETKQGLYKALTR